MRWNVILAVFFLSLNSLCYADGPHAGEPQPLANASAPSAHLQTPAQDARDDHFITRQGRKLYYTGTSESRDTEASVAITAFARSEGKNFDALSEEGQQAVILDAVREGPLSVNVFSSLYSAAALIRVLASDPGILASQTAEDREKRIQTKAWAREVEHAIATRLDLPDGYWNYEDGP